MKSSESGSKTEPEGPLRENYIISSAIVLKRPTERHVSSLRFGVGRCSEWYKLQMVVEQDEEIMTWNGSGHISISLCDKD